MVTLALTGAAYWLSACPSARAGVRERTVSYSLHYFTDVEGFDVLTHYGTSRMEWDNDLSFDCQWTHDVVVFPAISAPPGSQDAVDAITTASRPIASNTDPFEDFVKVRNSIEGSVNYLGANVGYYVSKESDYFAQMFSSAYSRGFLDDNLTLSAGMSYSWDSIKPLEDSDTSTIPDYRRTWHWDAVATQVLTRTTVVRLGAELNQVRGLQHAPYRNVYVAGSNVPEKHPSERSRRDIFVQLSQYVNNRSSIKLDYRYYDDDWGVTSHTYGGKLSQYVSEEFIVRYRYRYYTQVPAFFYRDDYTQVGGVDGYQTNDYRLGDYGAHLFGGELTWAPHRMPRGMGFLERMQMDLSYERYFNSNNFSANVYEAGLRITF